VDAGALGRHDAQQAAVAVAPFEVPDDEEVLERRVLGEALHPLESDAGQSRLAAPIVTIAPGCVSR